MTFLVAAGAVGVACYKGFTRSDSVEVKVMKFFDNFTADIEKLCDLAQNISKYNICDIKHQQNINEIDPSGVKGVKSMDNLKIRVLLKTTLLIICLASVLKLKNLYIRVLSLVAIYVGIVSLAKDSRLFKGVIALDLKRTIQDEINDLQSFVNRNKLDCGALNQRDANGDTPYDHARDRYRLLPSKFRELALFERDSFKAVQEQKDFDLKGSLRKQELENYMIRAPKVKTSFQASFQRLKHGFVKYKEMAVTAMRLASLDVNLEFLEHDIEKLRPTR